MSSQSATHGGRIPSLDGLRAISILLVLLAHALGTRDFPLHDLPSALIGDLGVRVFFVISGFLITGLLLKEYAKSGTISLRGFYWRRVIRIFPAFYLYLLVVVVLWRIGIVEATAGSLVQAITYTANYFPWDSQPVALRHLWSLSNEEQFYLIWPFLMTWGILRLAPRTAAAVVLIAPLIRLGVVLAGSPWTDTLDRRFDCLADTLATGCLLAFAQPWLARQDLYQRFQQSWWVVIGPILAAGGLATHNHPFVYYVVGESVSTFGIAITIDAAVHRRESAIGKLLNWSILTWVGGISYSLYLWQQIFLVHPSDAWWNAWPQNIIFAFAAAVASFYLVEEPVRKLGRKFSDRKIRTEVAVPG